MQITSLLLALLTLNDVNHIEVFNLKSILWCLKLKQLFKFVEMAIHSRIKLDLNRIFFCLLNNINNNMTEIFNSWFSIIYYIFNKHSIVFTYKPAYKHIFVPLLPFGVQSIYKFS